MHTSEPLVTLARLALDEATGVALSGRRRFVPFAMVDAGTGLSVHRFPGAFDDNRERALMMVRSSGTVCRAAVAWFGAVAVRGMSSSGLVVAASVIDEPESLQMAQLVEVSTRGRVRAVGGQLFVGRGPRLW